MSKRNPYDKQREILRKILISARKNKGITQTQLAAQLNKPQSFVSKYENGDRLVDLVEIYQICQALNQSFAELTENFDSEINELSANYYDNLKMHNHED